MKALYETTVIGEGNHASFVIPPHILQKLGANKRAPLRITINGHMYQSTATGVAGECRVVFPERDRQASAVESGDTVTVQLELDSGHREVALPLELDQALHTAGLREEFEQLTFSKRKAFARQVADAKGDDTRLKRVQAVLSEVTHYHSTH